MRAALPLLSHWIFSISIPNPMKQAQQGVRTERVHIALPLNCKQIDCFRLDCLLLHREEANDYIDKHLLYSTRIQAENIAPISLCQDSYLGLSYIIYQWYVHSSKYSFIVLTFALSYYVNYHCCMKLDFILFFSCV